jgi:hypothetical protein
MNTDTTLLKVVPIVVACGSLALNAVQFHLSRQDKSVDSRPGAYFALADDRRLLELFGAVDSTSTESPPGIAMTAAAKDMVAYIRGMNVAKEGVVRSAPVASFVAVCNKAKSVLKNVTIAAPVEPSHPIVVGEIESGQCVYAPYQFQSPDGGRQVELPPIVKIAYENPRGQIDLTPRTPVVWLQTHEVRAMIRHRDN